MDIKGTHRFQAPRERVWEALLNPQTLAQALPGGEELQEVGDNKYSATMNVRVGPVQGKFTGKIQLSDIRPREGYKMEVDGSGTAGFVQGVGTLSLQEDGHETVIDYAGEVQIGGRIASVGQRLVESTAKSLIRQGLRALDTQLQAGDGLAAAEPKPVPTPQATSEPSATQSTQDKPRQPSTTFPTSGQPQGPSAMSVATEAAKDVARDLASDYVSPSQQEKIGYMALGAIAMLLFVMLVRLVQRN